MLQKATFIETVWPRLCAARAARRGSSHPSLGLQSFRSEQGLTLTDPAAMAGFCLSGIPASRKACSAVVSDSAFAVACERVRRAHEAAASPAGRSPGAEEVCSAAVHRRASTVSRGGFGVLLVCVRQREVVMKRSRRVILQWIRSTRGHRPSRWVSVHVSCPSGNTDAPRLARRRLPECE